MIRLRRLSLMLVCGFFLFSCISHTNNTGDGTSAGNEFPNQEIKVQIAGEKIPVVMFREGNVRATGNEPFWMLELKNDSLQFKLMSGFEFRELLPAPTVNTKDSLQYNFKTGPATVAVLFQNQECIDNMSGFKSPFTVSVDFTGPDNTQHFNGCGDYLSAFDKVREQEHH